MAALQILLVLVLLTVCGFAPGFFVVRRLRWSPMEKLCGSIGLSLVLLYLITWEYYCLVPDAGAWAYAGVSLLCLVLGWIARKDIAALARSFRVRQALSGYTFLLVWTLLILSMIRVYSGAGWSGDWAEHFQRTLFFLHRFPVDTPIIGGYQIPARPPLMNVLAAFFLAQTQDRFEIFQIVFSFLNLLVFLPCCLIMPALGGQTRRKSILPLVALFALNPVIMQAATYSWPRGLTVFFVISAIALYLSAWRKKEPVRMTAAFLALSAGLLTHFSAGPYAVFVGLHYLICLFGSRPNKWRELALLGVPSSLLLATWFGWSIETYGKHVTFASNTTITSSEAYAGSTLGKIAANIVHSIVPAVVRDPSSPHFFDQTSRTGFLSDNVFIFYQSNIIFAMGLTGGGLVLWLLYRSFRSGSTRSPERAFWMAMIPFCIVLGIAVVGEADQFGVAHVTLLSLDILGITLLAGEFPLRKIAMLVLIAGCAVDFSLGVMLHVRMEGIDAGIDDTSGTTSQDLLSVYAQGNWRQKHQYALTGRVNPQAAARDDDSAWQGWYGRNGGSITLLGDHFDANGLLPALVLVQLGCLLWAMRKQRLR